MNITETHLTVSQNLAQTYYIKDGFISITATVYAIHEPGVWEKPDVHDVDLEFSLNSKQCKYGAFKKLYNELFGENAYTQYVDKINDLVETKFLNKYLKS